MKFSLLFTLFAAAEARRQTKQFHDEKSSLMMETESFWERELQASVAPTPTPPGPGTGPVNACGITDQQRRTQIMNTLSGPVSAANLLTTTDTPQYNAVEWLIGSDEFFVCPGDEKLIQRYVMALFYFSTDGASWDQCKQAGGACPPGNKRYLSKDNECDWFGNTCDAEKCITEIIFGKCTSVSIDISDIRTHIVFSLVCSHMSTLVYVTHSNVTTESNSLAGTIPFELEQLTELQVLSLEQGTTGSSIPSNLGTLSNLRILDLDFNQITGPIPEQIYGLTNLEQLDLNTNKITGTISNNMGNLASLRLFQLYENLMTGTVPVSLGNIDSLVIVEFFNNTFTGTMPQAVCDNRAPPTGTGSITGLTADCFPNPVPQIICNCCTGCAVF